MISNWKTVAVGLFIVFAFGWLSISEAAGQFIQGQHPTRKTGNTPPAYGQPGMAQPGMMQRGTAQPAHSRTAKSNETFCIVEVGKEKALQIVSKPNGLKDLKKRLEDEYKTANKAYQDAKKDKKNKGVSLERPVKQTVREIKSGLKTEEKAQEELQKLQAEREKNGSKKRRSITGQRKRT